MRKRALIRLLACLAFLAGATQARATVITETFSGVASGGTGSAVLTFSNDPGSSWLSIRIDNTSPNILNSGTGLNSAIITGFGFSVTPNLPSVLSWSVKAGNGLDITSRYQLNYDAGFNGAGGGVTVEDLFSTTNGINGGIYNAASPGNTANAYPDIALVTISFCAPYTLSTIDTATLRMQRVGDGGTGSLKLLGVAAVQYAAPEPDAFILFLTGIPALLRYKRRRTKSC